MKLLFDENLSGGLAETLSDLFPDSAGVRSIGLKSVSDAEVWAYAGKSGFLIVTKDDDFKELSVLKGAPPKVIFLSIGNCTSKAIEALLRRSHSNILQFGVDDSSTILELS